MALDLQFYVHQKVINDLSARGLEQQNEEVVRRCIGGYSCPANIPDAIEKACYRLSQYLHSCPDWERSTSQLERNIKHDVNASKHHLGRMAEVIARMNNYPAEPGEVTLKAFIYENNGYIIQLSNQQRNSD